MKRVVAAALFSMFACGAAAQDPARGQALYETHCLECHYERVHKRDASRSRVRSYAALQAEVARWAELTKQRFALADLDDITEYLNRSHYNFPR